MLLKDWTGTIPVTGQNASDLVGKMRILKKLSFSIEISVRQY